MSKIITHTNNPNKSIKHPRHWNTWSCKCGAINDSNQEDCKMIRLLVNFPELAKSLRGRNSAQIKSGEQRFRSRDKREASARLKAQVAEVDAWLASPLID